MFLTHMAALVVTAFQEGLTKDGHPVLGGRKPWVGPDFPLEKAHYPGVWVDFTPAANLTSAGLGHRERTAVPGTEMTRQGTRWLFSGTVEATVVALDRRERDELLDEVLRLIAFADEHPQTSGLKATMEANPFIAVNSRFGQVRLGGISNAGSTPWGSDDIVYEGTVSFDVEGEFVSDVTSQHVLLPLEAVEIVEEVEGAPEGFDTTQWH